MNNPMPLFCGAKTRAGAPCRQHPVDGHQRCRMHGGTSPGRPIITGRYSVTHRQALAAKMQRFLDDPAPGDLTAELALMRALLQDYLDRFKDGIALPAQDIATIFEMVESIGRLVERVARIFSQTALTAAEVQLLQARIADLVGTYVPADRQLEFLDALAQTLGGDRRGADAYPALTAD